jgi:hypothetical protein
LEERLVVRHTGARLMNNETRILSWSDDHTLRLWDVDWPKGNLLEVTCALLPMEERDATDGLKRKSMA